MRYGVSVEWEGKCGHEAYHALVQRGLRTSAEVVAFILCSSTTAHEKEDEKEISLESIPRVVMILSNHSDWTSKLRGPIHS